MHAVLISGATRSDIKPHEIYNLAAQSHVGLSFKHPELTVAASGLVRTSYMAFEWQHMATERGMKQHLAYPLHCTTAICVVTHLRCFILRMNILHM